MLNQNCLSLTFFTLLPLFKFSPSVMNIVFGEEDVELEQGQGGELVEVGLVQPVHAGLATPARLQHQLLTTQ